MNVRLLQRVQQHILAHPHRFCAAQWAYARNAHDVLHHGAPPDGFRCCIAGHALLLGGRFDEAALLSQHRHFDNGTLSRQARDVLTLTADQYRELFFPSQWCDPYRTDYYLSATREAEAAACAGFIGHFLECHASLSLLADDRLPVPHATEPASRAVALRPSIADQDGVKV